jgi:hypothetical protein
VKGERLGEFEELLLLALIGWNSRASYDQRWEMPRRSAAESASGCSP